MTYASTVLTRELQRAVKNRVDAQLPAKALASAPRSLEYKVSAEARAHLERLRNYREQAKHVRVGTY